MKPILYIFIAIFTLTSCASKRTRKYNRAQKLITKAVQLSPEIEQADTLQFELPYKTNARSTATNIPLQKIVELRDTITQIDTFTNIKIHLNKQVDTLTQTEYINIKADCEPNTELVPVEVEADRIIYQTNEKAVRKQKLWKNIYKLILFFVLFFTVLKLLKL